MDFIKIYIKGIGTIEGDPDDIEMLAVYLDDAAAYNKALGNTYIMKGDRELGEDLLDSHDLIKSFSDNIRYLLSLKETSDDIQSKA